LVSVCPAALVGFGLAFSLSHRLSPLSRLSLECILLFTTYFALLLFVAGEKDFYLDLFRRLKGPAAVEGEDLAAGPTPASDRAQA